MCRMLGLTNFVFRKHEGILTDFFELAESGKTLPEDSPGHLDGWGIGFYKNGTAVVHKSGHSIVKEKGAFFKICETVNTSNILLIHFRKSSWKGTSKLVHAHPFMAGNVLFAHNGTIRDFKTLRKKIILNPPPPQTLDTEVYLRYVMNFISLGLANAFQKAIRDIRSNHRYSSLTCLFSDGDRLYGFREYTRAPWYYTLYHARREEAAMISSQPVSKDLHWKMVPRRKLLVL